MIGKKVACNNKQPFLLSYFQQVIFIFRKLFILD